MVSSSPPSCSTIEGGHVSPATPSACSAHPLTGGPLDHKHYAATLKDALAKGKVEGPMRPFHDGRHSSITNGAATGINPHALMARAGHSDFKTTSLYIDLAGETFREEAAKVGERIFASVGQKTGPARVTVSLPPSPSCGTL